MFSRQERQAHVIVIPFWARLHLPCIDAARFFSLFSRWGRPSSGQTLSHQAKKARSFKAVKYSSKSVIMCQTIMPTTKMSWKVLAFNDASFGGAIANYVAVRSFGACENLGNGLSLPNEA